MNPNYVSDLDDSLTFYAGTAVIVSPGSAEIRRGEQATTVVTARHKGTISEYPISMLVVDPGIPGVRIEQIEDDASIGNDRLLMRLWLGMPNSRALPEDHAVL